jgi:Tol biopolymer transport system component
MRRSAIGLVLGVVGLLGFGGPAGASSAPTNGKIAFSRGDVVTDTSRGFTINPDGTGENQVGVGVHDVNCGDWSPDSSKLLCQDFVDVEGARPAIANPDGSGFTVLDAYPGVQQNLNCSAWSPNGARLLCGSGEDDNPADDGLRTVRASDGGGQVQITSTPIGSEDFPFGYTPDGSRILFNRVSDTTNHILYAVNPDGSGLVRLSPPTLSVVDLDNFDSVSADWSPTATQVTFAARWKLSTGNGRQWALFVVNADGSALRQITPSGLGAISAQWSPDGQLIAFTSKARADQQVWVVHPNGTGLSQLTYPTNGSRALAPIWSPDGTKLLFQQATLLGDQALWTINIDGTGLSKVAAIPGPDGYSWGSAPTS